jgi:hypothetical protein
MSLSEICLYLVLGVMTYVGVNAASKESLQWPETFIIILFWPVVLLAGAFASAYAAIAKWRRSDGGDHSG